MIFFAWYSLDFNSISDWRITSPRCYPADKWSSTEFRKWKRQEGEKTSRSRFTRHERNGNDIIRFFFFSFAWKKRSRIVDIFLVFEFQPSVFSCRGLLRSKGWTTRNRVLISSVNLLLRLRPENSPKQSDVRENCIRRGTRRIIVPTFVFLLLNAILVSSSSSQMFEFQLQYADDCRKTLAIHDFSNEKDTKTSSEISLSTLDSRMILSISRENLQIRWTKRIIQRFFFFFSGQKLPWNGISIEVTLKIDFIARDCRIDESSYISIESSITHARNRSGYPGSIRTRIEDVGN